MYMSQSEYPKAIALSYLRKLLFYYFFGNIVFAQRTFGLLRALSVPNIFLPFFRETYYVWRFEILLET